MAFRWHDLPRSLTLRLVVLTALLLVPLAALHAALMLHSTQEEWLGFLEGCATRTSGLIKSAIHSEMALSDHDGVQEIVERLVAEPTVSQLRIHDKNGVVVYSGDRSELGSRVDPRAEACVVCHEGTSPGRTTPTSRRIRRFENAKGEQVLGLITPVENAPECATAGCHLGLDKQTVLGVMDLQVSVAWMEESLARQRWLIVAAALFLGLIGVTALTVGSRRVVTGPIRRLVRATEKVAAGDLTTRLAGFYDDELGQLANAFNRMTTDLQSAQVELRNWSERLEKKVVEKTEELGRVQQQIVHVEKMASLGQLSATVAHELNNPLSSILTYAKVIGRELEGADLPAETAAELQRYLQVVRQESARCGTIVQSLLLFARHSSPEPVEASLREIVDRALMLTRHHIEIGNIELVDNVQREDDVLRCEPNRLQQALVALLINATEAMPDGGTLTLTSRSTPDTVTILVTDTGVGMTGEVLAQIFEPFYSTKEEQSGVGLGLAVVYGIIEQHQGTIDVVSDPGHGTTFELRLPRNPPRTRPLHTVASAPEQGRKEDAR